jgi:hypothetical protein
LESLVNHPWELGLLFALALAAAIEVGRRVALRAGIQQDEDRREQMAAIRDGLFILVSLLLGFTLALAVPRYEQRQSLLVDEVNAIGTTYLRAATLPQPYRDHAQQLLRQYVDVRLDLDAAAQDYHQLTETSDSSKEIQDQLWRDVVAVTETDRSAITDTYINTLNEAIDLHEKRVAALENRIPSTVWLLILVISLITVFTRGLTITRRFWLTLLLAPITIAIVVALVADLDTPSSGFIRLDQRAMQRLKADISDPHYERR